MHCLQHGGCANLWASCYICSVPLEKRASGSGLWVEGFHPGVQWNQPSQPLPHIVSWRKTKGKCVQPEEWRASVREEPALTRDKTYLLTAPVIDNVRAGPAVAGTATAKGAGAAAATGAASPGAAAAAIGAAATRAAAALLTTILYLL